MQIGAVIVSYNISTQILPLLDRLRDMVPHCIIVDNGSTDDTCDVIADAIACYTQGAQFQLIVNDENNLGKAHNIGIAAVRDAGCDAVLLLDHDSLPEADMLEVMRNYLARHPDVGMVIPNLREQHSKRAARYICHAYRLLSLRRGFGDRDALTHVMAAISSGSLIPMRVLDVVGRMREDFVIDAIDHEFSLRLLRHGYGITALRAAGMRHALGQSQDHQAGRVRITTTNHSAARRYTIYRNRITVWRLHGRFMPAYIVFDVMAIGYDLFKIVMFEDQRREKLSALWRGVRDGTCS